MGRISTFNQNNSIITNNTKVFEKLNDVNLQNASGLKAQDYYKISTSSKLIMQTDNNIKQSQQTVKNLELVKQTVTEGIVILEDLIDLSSQMLKDIAQILPGIYSTERVYIIESANITLDNLENLLNSKNSLDEFIFSGNETISKSVDLSLMAPPADYNAINTLDFSYYIGGTDPLKKQLGPDLNLDVGISAQSKGISGLIQGLQAIGNLNNYTDPNDALEKIFTLMEENLDELIVQRNKVSVQQEHIIAAEDFEKTKLDNYKLLNIQLKDADIGETIAQAQALEVQLSSSYKVTSTIMSNTILNYLK